MRSLDPPGETNTLAIGSSVAASNPASSAISPDRGFRRLACLDHSGDQVGKPAARLLEGRIFELLREMDAPSLHVHEQRRGRVAALEAQAPHHRAHGPVIALVAQQRFVDLEEIVEHALAADHFDLAHPASPRA
jgi:hypothetical protein